MKQLALGHFAESSVGARRDVGDRQNVYHHNDCGDNHIGDSRKIISTSEHSTSASIRERCGHPIIDADGHVIEFMPAVWPYLRQALGRERFDAYRATAMPVEQSIGGGGGQAWREATRAPQSAWWASPAANTRDLATAALPQLMYERLDEFGLDLAVLFPTRPLGSGRIEDDDMRAGVCRGFNDYFADAYRPFADRLRPVGIIPMDTPEEAIAELRHCADVGLRAAAIPEGVWRPIPTPAPAAEQSTWLVPGQTHWFDNFDLDSAHDYDPVWATFQELGYPVLAHGGLGHVAPNQYLSITNYSVNHIGSFRDKMFQLCKSLYMFGVTRRFPELRFGFMECGVSWASTLIADIVEHWEKRNLDALAALDPAAIDYGVLEAALETYGRGVTDGVDDLRGEFSRLHATGAPPVARDEWRHLGATDPQDLVDLFSPRMYFGCEADDRMITSAFSPANPGTTDLRPVFSSDIGHWDVTDMATVVEESWGLVANGLLTEANYRAFVFDNPVDLLGSEFFVGTPAERAVMAAGPSGRRDV
jgi:predicted TIM-barrel fold metal-dependent hydrolase